MAERAKRPSARDRARLTAKRIAYAIEIERTTLRTIKPNISDDELQAALERTAITVAGRAAHDDAALMVALGRQAAGEAYRDEIGGVIYTSILDKNRCQPCADADDGMVRHLDDPVRLAHLPPNPDCKGRTRCRCEEFYVLKADRRDPRSGRYVALPGSDEPISLYADDQPRWPKGHPFGGRWRNTGEHPASIGRGGGVSFAGLKHTDLIGFPCRLVDGRQGVIVEAYGVEGYTHPKTGDWIKFEQPKVYAQVELEDGTSVTYATQALTRVGTGKRRADVRQRVLGEEFKPPPKPKPRREVKVTPDVIDDLNVVGEDFDVVERERSIVELGKQIMASVDEGQMRQVEADANRLLIKNETMIANAEQAERELLRQAGERRAQLEDTLGVEGEWANPIARRRKAIELSYTDEKYQAIQEALRKRQAERRDLRAETVVIRRKAKRARGLALKAALEQHGVKLGVDRKLWQRGGVGKRRSDVFDSLMEASEFIPPEWVEASNAHERRLAPRTSRSRAHYQHMKFKGGESIRELTADKNDASVALHEFAHATGYLHPAINALEQQHRRRRVAESADPSKQRLKHLGGGYGRSERGYEDEFADVYTGKVYGNDDGKDRATEVLSMGMQLAFYGDNSRRRDTENPWDADPELVAFTVGVVASQRRDVAAERAERERAQEKLKEELRGPEWHGVLVLSEQNVARLNALAMGENDRDASLLSDELVRTRSHITAQVSKGNRGNVSDAIDRLRSLNLRAEEKLDPEASARKLRMQISAELNDGIPADWHEAIMEWMRVESNPTKLSNVLTNAVQAYKRHGDRDAAASVLSRSGVQVEVPWMRKSIDEVTSMIVSKATTAPGAEKESPLTAAPEIAGPLDRFLAELRAPGGTDLKYRRSQELLAALQNPAPMEATSAATWKAQKVRELLIRYGMM